MDDVLKVDILKPDHSAALKFSRPELTRDTGSRNRFMMEATTAPGLRYKMLTTSGMRVTSVMPRIEMKYVTVVLLLVAISLCPSRTVAQWTQTNGPYGGTIMALAINDSHLFAGIRGAGIYHSTDSGMQWGQVNSGLTNLNLWVLFFDGTNLFAGTEEGGAFRTTDYGAHWTAANGGFPQWSYVFAFARIGGHLYAGTRDGVFVSTDSGTNWNPVNSGLTNTFVRALAVKGSDLFAGTNGGVFRSTDSGATWISCNTGLPGDEVWALAAVGTHLFAGYRWGQGVFRSTDSGATWTSVNTGLSNTLVLTFTSDSSSLLAGTFGGGVFRTTDYGTNWMPCGPAGHFAWAVSKTAAFLFAGTAGGIFRSSDNGTSWLEIDSGITHSYVGALACVDTDLFASARSNGVARSTDNGNTWTPVNNGIASTVVLCLAVSGDDLFAGAWEAGVYLSTNRGTSWTGVNTGLTNNLVLSLFAHEGDVFAGTYGGVFRTTDRGGRWLPNNSGLPGVPVGAFAAKDTFLFAGTRGNGVYRSTDHGVSWTPANSGIATASAEALAVCDSCLFMGTPTGLFRSSDNGATWSTANTGMGQRWVLSLAVSGSSIFAGTEDRIALSTNSGTAWESVDDGLTCMSAHKWIRSLIVCDPFLYAGTGKDGVWRRPLSDMIAPAGALAIAVTDAEDWGSPGARARVVLYNYSDTQIAEGPTDANGVVTFANTPAGTGYSYRVYVSDPWKPWGEQFWGEKTGITITAGQATVDSFIHNTPYMPAVRVLMGGTNEELPPGGKRPLTAGTALRVELLIKNPVYPGASAVSVYGALRFDRDQVSPFDVFLTTTSQDLSPGTLDTVSFNCTAPTVPGEYSYCVAAYASSARYPTLLTDASGWYDPAFRVDPGTGVKGGTEGEQCTVFALEPNYPNPFNGSTVVRFGVPTASHVTITVYNALGQEVRTLIDGEFGIGFHDLIFDAAGLTSGVYMLRMKSGPFFQVRRVALIR